MRKDPNNKKTKLFERDPSVSREGRSTRKILDNHFISRHQSVLAEVLIYGQLCISSGLLTAWFSDTFCSCNVIFLFTARYYRN